jgi:YVTN family beta-propeller protein
MRRCPLLVGLTVALAAFAVLAWPTAARAQITRDTWGRVVSPVYGSASPDRHGAERYAGPQQFGDDYFHGVLPNGRIVRPAGQSVQVGMNPLGARLTPDGKFLVTTNDNDEKAAIASQHDAGNRYGYSLTVIETSTMKIASRMNAAGRFFLGLQITGSGPYTVWASGGGDHDVKRFVLSASGAISPAGRVLIDPITPADAGFVSHYKPSAAFGAADAEGHRPPAPTGFNRTAGAAMTFPAGSALSPDGRFLYVACNGDNSLAVIDTAAMKVVRQVAVGYFPYDVTTSADGRWAFVSNWGVTEYTFAKPTYAADGTLTALAPIEGNRPAGFFVPKTDTTGSAPKTSSVSVVTIPNGDGARASLVRSVYMGAPLDALRQVGDTHPSAMALVTRGTRRVLFVVKANSDSLGVIRLRQGTGRQAGQVVTDVRPDLDLSPLKVTGVDPAVIGATPNAIVASADGSRVYVAEAGLNAVAVVDTTNPEAPRLAGRIPTGWYPTAVDLSRDGRLLYVASAKGIAEDLSPAAGSAPASKVPGEAGRLVKIDANYIFGSVQKVDLRSTRADSRAVLANNFTVAASVDTRVVPEGGAASRKITHVFFILHENKTFDSMLGNMTQLGPFASLTFADSAGARFDDAQYVSVAKNLQALAARFAVGVNYYSDSEESDAGHQFAASGTATDYAEKTLANRTVRGMLIDKNQDAEDYPASGYIFNNAARHGVSFKDYGDLIRIIGTDTGYSAPSLDDPASGKAGYPSLPVTAPATNQGDVDSAVRGLGQAYFTNNPALAVLGTPNANGEPRLDMNYPGYNLNISDQRRAAQFCRDFDRMVAAGTLPQFLYIYQPNDHMGAVVAKNLAEFTPSMQVADGDAALGMVVEHIMRSPVYYDPRTGEGSAIFITWDDAQSTLDHIHPHRTPLVVVSPYAKPGAATRHYSTASIVKTEELLLGLPPNNLGDLFATDLRDMFQPEYNGVTAGDLTFTRTYSYKASEEGLKIWALAGTLDLLGPDRDSRRLGTLARLSILADTLHAEAERGGTLDAESYRRQQAELYELAETVASGADPDDPNRGSGL